MKTNDNYYKSNAWRLKKIARLQIDGQTCQCGNVATHVHHKTYERFGNENPLTDLISKCAECHAEGHGQAKIEGCFTSDQAAKAYKAFNDFVGDYKDVFLVANRDQIKSIPRFAKLSDRQLCDILTLLSYETVDQYYESQLHNIFNWH